MSSPQTEAARILLREACELLAQYGQNAVLIGGWVPDIRFPDASPAHIGSIDVDMLLRMQKDQHDAVVALLLSSGFRRGKHRYQFIKNVVIESGSTVPTRLDLLTSSRHHLEFFAATENSLQPIHGADIAFHDNELLPIGFTGEIEIRVAGIVAFLTMKGIALRDRDKPKDAYDIHYCLEHYPDGIAALVTEFAPFRNDPVVIESMRTIAGKFKDAEDEGPRLIADIEGEMGEFRAIRKLQAYTRVGEFLAALKINA